MNNLIQQIIIKLEATYGAEAAFEVTKHLAAAWEAARKLERADEKAIRECAA